MTETAFKTTPLSTRAPRRAGERTFRERSAIDDALDHQYAFDWPSGWSRDRENRILPGLFIGGLEAAKVAEGQYDLIVNMDGARVRPLAFNGTPEIVWPIGDSQQMPDLDRLWAIANSVAAFLRTPAKPRVLIHCAAGINRSALMCAAVVMLLRDCNGRTAMRTVRRARLGALANQTFAAWLTGHGRPTRRRRATRGVWWPTETGGAS
jgi:hypothetical protein